MAKKQTTELAVIENTEVLELIQKSGIELTKAEAHAAAFHPLLVQLAELSRPLAGLNKENPSKEDAKIARENRLKIVKVRTAGEAVKKERSEMVDLEKDFILANNKLLKTGCHLTEAEYEEVEKADERRDIAIKTELKESRIALLAPYETDTEFLPLDIMDEEKFQALLAKEKETFEAVKKAREQSELDRIAAEKLAEENRLAEIEAEKERQKERDAEIAELKKQEDQRQKDEINRIKKEEANAEKLANLLTDNGYELGNNDSYIDKMYHTYSKGGYVVKYHELSTMKEDDLLTYIKDTDTRIQEFEAKQAELKAEREARDKIQKELEAKQLAEENDRLAKVAEQEEKDAKAKALLLGPDKDKVKAFFETFKALQFPDLQSEAGKAMTIRVNEALAIVKQVIIQDSKTLL